MRRTASATAIAAALAASMALAAQAQDDQQPGQDQGLESIVITATRTVGTVNTAPMAVSAITEKALEAQGIKGVADLARTVPGLTFRTSGGENNPNVTIRGIGGNGATVGSPTTGVYIDDSPLQRRNVNGLVTGNGSPFPQMFDLQRVEVLRGPQGTLYGGSSQGGTVRFITPTPSLSEYSATAKAEATMIEGGDPGHEVGLAVGGPLVEDKLGFRISGVDRHTGGWIDAVSMYDGHEFGTNVNDADARAVRAALLWQVTPAMAVTPAVYYGYEYSNAGDGFQLPTPEVNFTGGTILNGGTTFTSGANAGLPRCSGNTLNPIACRTTGGVVFAFPDTTVPAFTQVATPWLGKDKTTNGRYYSEDDVAFEPSPRETELWMPTLTVDWDLTELAIKSVTTYVNDVTEGVRFAGGGTGTRGLGRFVYGTQPCQAPYNTPQADGTCYLNPSYYPGLSDYYSYYNYYNKRNQGTEELRFSSQPGDDPLSFVSGLYYSFSTIHMHGSELSNENWRIEQIRGAPEAWYIGNYPLTQPPGTSVIPGDFQTAYIDVSDREIVMKETEMAAFGEVNYDLTSTLRLTAGVRVTRYTQNFDQQYGGAVAGITLPGVSTANPDGFQVTSHGLTPAVPGSPGSATNPITDPLDLRPFQVNLDGCPSADDCPLQYTQLSVTESPVSPKVGISWEPTDRQLYYATYSEGFRAGGVNPAVPPAQCRDDLAALGIDAVPETFDGDTVKSYEVGAKIGLFGGNVQMNSSVFYTNWDEMQFNFGLRCGFAFVSNAASAISQGAETQITARIGDLTLDTAIGYNDAAFAEDVKNPSSGALLQKEGDNVGVPEWTFSVGATYDFEVASLPGFARVDYQYTGEYARTPGEGVSTYDPLIHDGDPTEVWNARVGLTVKSVDFNLFVQNLTDSDDFIGKGHGQDSLQITGTTFRPRTWGVSATYRY